MLTFFIESEMKMNGTRSVMEETIQGDLALSNGVVKCDLIFVATNANRSSSVFGNGAVVKDNRDGQRSSLVARSPRILTEDLKNHICNKITHERRNARATVRRVKFTDFSLIFPKKKRKRKETARLFGPTTQSPPATKFLATTHHRDDFCTSFTSYRSKTNVSYLLLDFTLPN
jgi:hypothetical protein